MGRFFKFIFQAFVSLLLVFLCTAAIISLDGSTDQGAQADTALVVSDAPVPATGDDVLLDRAAKLYNQGAFRLVIIGSTVSRLVADQPTAMAAYLEKHAVPADAILVEKSADTVDGIAQGTAQVLKARSLSSVMIVADYYRIVGLKLALYHENIVQIGKAHIGQICTGDIPAILHSTADLYTYATVTYLLPAAEKVREEAKTDAEKVTADAHKATDQVNKKLDSMAK